MSYDPLARLSFSKAEKVKKKKTKKTIKANRIDKNKLIQQQVITKKFTQKEVNIFLFFISVDICELDDINVCSHARNCCFRLSLISKLFSQCYLNFSSLLIASDLKCGLETSQKNCIFLNLKEIDYVFKFHWHCKLQRNKTGK